jgi:hypothetical protein
MLWESLPLKAGLDAETVPSAAVHAKQPVATIAEKPAVRAVDSGSTAEKRKPVVDTVASSKPSVKQSPAVEAARETPPEATEENVAAENVDELLAAVEAMRAKRPGLRARKAAPSVEEMTRRKDLLRATVGRILASL